MNICAGHWLYIADSAILPQNGNAKILPSLGSSLFPLSLDGGGFFHEKIMTQHIINFEFYVF